MMIFYIFTIPIIFQFGTIICKNLPPNNQLKTLNQCDSRSNISKTYNFNCTHFIECDQGSVVIKACAPETVFDPEKGICNWPYNVPQCFGVFGHENSIEESYNRNYNNLENIFDPIPPSIPDQPQWNTNQNQQLINNNQQPAEFPVNLPPLTFQYGNQNPKPQPDLLTTGNGNNVRNNLIFIPASTTQSPYYDPSQKLIFSDEQSVSSKNQQNGNRVYGSEQQKDNGYKPMSFATNNSNRPGNKPNIGQSNPGQSFANNNQNYLSANYGKHPTGDGQKYPVSQSGYQYNSYGISEPSDAIHFPKVKSLDLLNASPGKNPQPQRSNNQYNLSNGNRPVGNRRNHQFVFEEYQKDGNDDFKPQPVEDKSQSQSHHGLEKGYEYKEKLPQKENFTGYGPQILHINYNPHYERKLDDRNKNKNHQFNQVDSKNNSNQSKNIEEDDDERGYIDIRIVEKSNKNSDNSISS